MSDDLTQLRAFLDTDRYGRTHEHHDQLASTNDRAMAWLLQRGDRAPVDGAVVTADAQTAGRGRLGRAWSSPRGTDLYVSVISRPGEVSRGIGALGLAVGVGIREGILGAVRQVNDGACPIDVSLKWPNDLLIGGRKLGGILCEARWQGRRADIVMGFGINVHRTEFPAPLDDIATSLAVALRSHQRHVPTRAVLLGAVLDHLEPAVDRFYTAGFSGIRDRYAPHCVVLGREVSIPEGRPGEGELRGLAEGLDGDGALLVRPQGGGAAVRVENGDVWIAAPA